MRRRYVPDKHHRRSIRLKGWDYSRPGVYFVTICTHRRTLLFDYGRFREVAENAWRNIPRHAHARHVALDGWVLMPNHPHGILVLGKIPREEGPRWGEAGRDEESDADAVSLRPASPLTGRSPMAGPPIRLAAGSVGAIVGNFKSLVTRRFNNLRRTPGGRVWQRGYYDRILRSERSLAAARRYIRDNPARWDEDRENLEAVLARMQRRTGR